MMGETRTPRSGEDEKHTSENKETESTDANPGSENTAIVESREREKRTQDAIQVLEQELQRLREKVEASDQKRAELEEKNADLTKTLEDTNSSLTSNLNLTILEFVAGFLGWSPILPFNVCCGDGNGKLIDGRDPSGWIERVWVHIRIPFFVFGSILDLADAILDLYVASSGILEGSCDEGSLPGWALWYYTMTLLARAVGGCFGVVYESIPESDRELTYFLVEFTIFIMEDCASILYIQSRWWLLEVETGLMETINAGLSGCCAILFAIPTLCRYKTFTKEFPCYASSFLLGWYLFVTLGTLFAMVVLIILPALGIYEPSVWVENNLVQHPETYFRSVYSVALSVQLFFLYQWIQHLINKERKSREEQRRDSDPGQGGSLILASQEISA